MGGKVIQMPIKLAQLAIIELRCHSCKKNKI